MKKQKIFKFSDPMYYGHIMLAVGGDRTLAVKKYHRWIEDDNPDPAPPPSEESSPAFVRYIPGGSYFLIFIEAKPKKPQNQAEIAHECLHVTMFLLNSRGVKYESGSENDQNEAFTYYLSWLLREVYERMEKL